jgi:hypothetical protein
MCFDDGRLGARFFFSRSEGELKTACRFIISISVQLARWRSLLNKPISAALRA